MRATVLHAPHDVRIEDRPKATLQLPTDAVIRTVATCVCGSDLWDYRGINGYRAMDERRAIKTLLHP